MAESTPVEIGSEKKRTMWTKAFAIVFITALLMYFGLQMTNSYFGKLINSFNVAPFVIGTVTSSYAATSLIMKFVAGPIIDAWNRKRILMVTMGLMAISFFGYGFATSLPAIIVFRLLQGISMSFVTSILAVLAANTSGGSKVGTGIGVFSMTQAAAQMIAPTISTSVATFTGNHHLPMLIGGVLVVISIVFSTRIILSKSDIGGRKPVFKPSTMLAKECALPAIIAFLMELSFYNVTTYLFVYATELDPSPEMAAGIGLYNLFYSGVAFLTRPLYGKLLDRFGFVRIIIPALVIFGIVFVLYSFAAELWQFWQSACSPDSAMGRHRRSSRASASSSCRPSAAVRAFRRGMSRRMPETSSDRPLPA